jgi:hypothetical protein
MFLRAVVALVLIMALAGCSWSREEPGLFGELSTPPPPVAPGDPGSGLPTPGTVDPDLPVLGERIWISGDGEALPLRIAIHGLRRVEGATVLDWSLTPLAQVGLSYGDKVPLAPLLSGPADPEAFRLVDARRRTVFRPLANTDDGGCLCLLPPGKTLRVGVTLLQQVVFPELPSHQQTITVDMPHVALFNGVPLPPPGAVVRATKPVDLARPPEVADGIDWTAPFDGPGGQRLRIGVIAVDVSADATSVLWTIETLTDGPGIGAGTAPITDTVDAGQDRSTASGLQLAVSGSADPITVLRSAAEGRSAKQAGCLCTDLASGWADGMTEAQRSVTVITNLPPLPLHTQRVDVLLPGLEPISRVQVSYPDDAATYFAGFIGTQRVRWSSPPPFQGTAEPIGDWPNALPAEEMLSHFRTVTEQLI